MSASTIENWNSIPLERPWDISPGINANKRSRSHTSRTQSDSDSEDNVSLVSRSPSPEPEKRRKGDDISVDDLHLYDEHKDVRGYALERVTVDTKITSSNKGFALLAKMGWMEGKPVGISGDGRVDPVPFTLKYDSSGLGKYRQDFEVIETTVSQRRNLESERMQNETLEQRQQREAYVAQKAAIASEVTQVLRPFYCELCDKQFANVAQYDEHTNSYAHHHKARARDMASHHPVRAGGKEEAEKRKEKERKREEKELRKIAKAAGMKINTPSGLGIVGRPPSLSAGTSVSSVSEGKSEQASIGGTGTSQVTPPTSTGSGGWAKVSTPAQPAVPRNPAWQRLPSSSSSSSALHPPSAESVSGPPTKPTNSFRSGGFTTLLTTEPVAASSSLQSTDNLHSQVRSDTGLSGLSEARVPVFDTPQASSSSGWARTAPTGMLDNSASLASFLPASSPSLPSKASFIPASSSPQPSSMPPNPPPSHGFPPPEPTSFSKPQSLSNMQSAQEKKKKKSRAPDDEPQSRGNWQSFQRGRGRR